MSGRIKPNISLWDKSFKETDTQYYNMTMQISLHGFYFTLFDTHKNKFLGLETYLFSNLDNEEDIAGELDQIISNSNRLTAGFNTVKVLYNNEYSTLVPAPLFNEEYLVAANLHAHDKDSVINLALSITMSDITHYFCAFLTSKKSIRYNKEAKKFDIREETYFLQLLLHSKPVQASKDQDFKKLLLELVKKEGLPEIAREMVSGFFKAGINARYDEQHSIGKRYRRHDEAGTPYCITIDGQTTKDGTVTIRDRDTMEQERISKDEALQVVQKRLIES